MRNPKQSKTTQTCLLVSLALHIILAFVMAFIIIESPQEDASGSLGVEIMMNPTKRVTPPRRMERREAWTNPSARTPQKHQTKAQLERQRLNQIDTDFSSQINSFDAATMLPELSTNAKKIKSRVDMPLPRATGANVAKPGASSRQSGNGAGSGAGLVGLSAEAGIFETAMYWIGRNTVSQNKTGKEDIVFLIDASGSMEENIAATARYLSKMIDVFKESELDYTIGVVRFNRMLKKNDIKVYKQTKNANKIRAILRSIKCEGDERTLDALEIGLTKVDFRQPTDKTFILVTDEAFTPRSTTRQSRRDLTLGEMLKEDFQELVEICQVEGVKVSVLGIDDKLHKSLTKETGGLWFQVPKQADQ